MNNTLKVLEEAIEYADRTGSYSTLNCLEKADYVCIWGAGQFFQEAYERQFYNMGVRIDYVVDKDPDKIGKTYFKKVRCISPEELFRLKNAVVIPLLNNGFNEVIDTCKKHNIRYIMPEHYFFDMHEDGNRSKEWFEKNKSKIIEVYKSLEDEESRYIYAHIIRNRIALDLMQVDYPQLYSEGIYFKPKGLEDTWKISEHETLLDVGAFDGDTIQEFLEVVHNRFENIYSLEISKRNYSILKSNIEKYPKEIRDKITCYHSGAWNKQIKIRCGEESTHTGEGFSINKGKGKFLKEDEAEFAECQRLDDLFEQKKITILKMDIEGAECQALEGAIQLISMQKPKLAICIYHNLSDLWEIPLMIKRMNPEYKLAIRHHTKGTGDTVCYAWV